MTRPDTFGRPVLLTIRIDQRSYKWEIRSYSGGIPLVTTDAKYASADTARREGEQALATYNAERSRPQVE